MDSTKKTWRKIFKIAHRLSKCQGKRWAYSCVTITGCVFITFNVFITLNLKQPSWKSKKFFKKLECCFQLKLLRGKFTFPNKTALVKGFPKINKMGRKLDLS